jgi:hypothetical protein
MLQDPLLLWLLLWLLSFDAATAALRQASVTGRESQTMRGHGP